MIILDRLHEVKRVEERGDEAGGHGEEQGQLGLQKRVVVLVFARSGLEILLQLEKVLLIRD